LDPRRISVIVTCRNEAPNLLRCLESVDGFGETVVVDSFSDDGTVDIARRLGATVYQRPYKSAALQKNWALGIVRNRWVLILDADEALTPSLRREIEAVEPVDVDGYWIRRQSEYFGRLIRGCGWQRDRVLRLFDRERGRYEEREVHEEVTVRGSAPTLKERMVHYPYRSIAHHLLKINEYTTRGARDYVGGGGKMAIANMIVHPPFRFLRMYLIQKGFADGAQGALLCLLASYAVFLKYAKAWELQWRRR